MFQYRMDPRVQLISMLLIAFVAMTGQTSGNQIYPRLVLILIPSIALVYMRYVKTGLICIVLLLLGWYVETFEFSNQHLIIGSLAFILSNLITRFLPAAILGFILMRTTSVERMLCGLNLMKVPRIITIPMAVMLRFMPVFFQESQNIKQAMAMRGITTWYLYQHPIRYIELRLVPLFNQVVKLSNDLTMVAMTRGLTTNHMRTSCIHLKIKGLDIAVLGVILLLVIIYYFI